jgi:hypothetical protein
MGTFRSTRMLLCLPLLTAGTLVVAASPAFAHDTPHDHAAVTVRVGTSIQKALDAAPAGAIVTIEPGAYWENLVISKPVELHGFNVVLLRPTTPTDGPCTFEGTASAICVFDMGDPDATTAPARLAGVAIEGIHIRGASGDGITAINTSGLNVNSSIVLVDSIGASVMHNEIGRNQGPGVVLTETVNAAARIEYNLSYDNAAGILVINATGAEIDWNDLRGNCIGLAVADHSLNSAAGGVTATQNLIFENNNPACIESDRSGIGVLLSGAVDVALNENVINGNIAAGPIGGSGIAIIDSSDSDGGKPMHINATDNRLTNNRVDLTSDGSGTHVDLSGNHCRTSNPADMCTPLVDDEDDIR